MGSFSFFVPGDGLRENDVALGNRTSYNTSIKQNEIHFFEKNREITKQVLPNINSLLAYSQPLLHAVLLLSSPLGDDGRTSSAYDDDDDDNGDKVKDTRYSQPHALTQTPSPPEE